MKVATRGKAGLRELNLGYGSNNVRCLNEREDRILQISLNSLEKARQKTLDRLQSEVKGLHSTLREQVTIRSQPIMLLTDTDDSETYTKISSTVTFDENCGILGTKPDNQAKSLEDLDDLEDSTLEHITLEDSGFYDRQKEEKGSVKTNNETENAWTRKLSSSTSSKTATKRQLSKQLSNSSDHCSSPAATLLVHRRKISVTDPLFTKEVRQGGLRKTLSQSSLQVCSDNLNRAKARSTEMINLATTYPNGHALNEPFMPSLRKTPNEAVNRVASPIFVRRKISHYHPSSLSSPLRPTRKVSCPPKLQQFARSVHQEEVIPLQLSREKNGRTSGLSVSMTTDLPKLSISHEVDQVTQIGDDKCPRGSVSPLGIHVVDGMDCTLQEKINNFLRSLERSDDTQEPKEKAFT